MEILITSLLLFGTAGILTLLRALRPQFRFSWLLVIAGSAAAWVSVWLWLPGLPVHLNILLWQSTASADSFAAFVATDISWPYAVSLTTLTLAYVLTAPARPGFPSPATWALSLAGVGLGLLGTTAQGPLTLVLFWAGLDLVEAGVVLAHPEGQGKSSLWPLTFTLRLGSMALVLLGLVLGETGSSATGFGAIQGAGAVILPAAGLLRLLALAAPGNSAADRDAVRLVLHLSGGAAAIAFLSQLSPAINAGSLLLRVGCAAAALYAGWMWIRGPDVSKAQTLWLVGMGSLAVAAVMRGNPLGATAVGSAMILAGSALMITTTQDSWTKRFALLGIVICSGLPLTLTARLWMNGSGTLSLLPAFLVAQAMLLAGLFHFAWGQQNVSPHAMTTSSLRGFYRLGIALPIAVGLGLGFWGWPGALQAGNQVAAALVMLAVGALVWGKRRLGLLNPSPTHWSPRAAETLLSTTGNELARFRDILQRAATTITRTIEGEAGILWSIVVLVLFVSLIADRTR